jgi:hypothetical protein
LQANKKGYIQIDTPFKTKPIFKSFVGGCYVGIGFVDIG